MLTVMHVFVFVPAVVFGVVAGLCWGVCAMIDRRVGRAGQPTVAARPARRSFRPVVIQGGLAAAAMSALRVPQTPLGSGGAVVRTGGAARSYGG